MCNCVLAVTVNVTRHKITRMHDNAHTECDGRALGKSQLRSYFFAVCNLSARGREITSEMIIKIICQMSIKVEGNYINEINARPTSMR